MTTTTNPNTETSREDFTTGEGLRALLNRLHTGGDDAWVHDPVARDLMEFAADKYKALARKYRLDTWDAVAAAHYDIDVLAVDLTDDQYDNFLTVAEATARFADDLRTTREAHAAQPILRAL